MVINIIKIMGMYNYMPPRRPCLLLNMYNIGDINAAWITLEIFASFWLHRA